MVTQQEARSRAQNANVSKNGSKMMGKKTVVTWLGETEAHDYPAAASYLSLLYDAAKVTELVASLETAVMTNFLAKDIFQKQVVHRVLPLHSTRQRYHSTAALVSRDLESEVA